MGEIVETSRAVLTDDSFITINGKKYTHKNKDISIGNNGHIKAPIFEIENGHLLVANLYLIAEAKDGATEVKYNNNTFKVTLGGLTDGTGLTVKDVRGVNTQLNRKNEVTVSGNVVTQNSNNGKHIVAVTLESDGQEVVDPSIVVYALESNGNLGMTSPEDSGDIGDFYTYGIYLKYKNGDYTASDAGTKTINKKLIIPGKGNVSLKFILNAEEYKEV